MGMEYVGEILQDGRLSMPPEIVRNSALEKRSQFVCEKGLVGRQKGCLPKLKN